MNIFSIELFIDILVTLVHRHNPEFAKLLVEILNIYDKETEEAAGIGTTNFFEFYVKLIRNILEQYSSSGGTIDTQSVLLRLKSDQVVVQDPELYTNLKAVFTRTAPVTDAQYAFTIHRMQTTIVWYQNGKMIRSLFGKYMNVSAGSSPKQQENVMADLNKLCNEIVQLNSTSLNRPDAETANRTTFLDFTDKTSINKSLTTYQKTSVTNVFKTGLQGFNRAFGPCGGWKMGESIVFNALSHHGKTLSLLKMARWQVMYNKVSADFVNPTCIIYSLENETPQNLMLLYKELYINIYEKTPNPDASDTEVIELCSQFFNKNGWRLVIDRRLGAEFGYDELVNNFESYIASGFTPVMCVIDYMNMLKKGNDKTRGDHLLLRDIYTNVCNYLKSKNCTLVTAHQLNRKAAETARLNPVGAVKRFGVDMLADGMDPQREVDVAIYQHIEKDAKGRPFLTFNMDKHRYDTDTRPEDRYFAYQFDPVLGIKDDIAGTDASIKNIHAVPYNKEDEANRTEKAPSSSDGLFGD